jgi:coenzyme F420-reducing hydrogenase beta subunit
MAVCPKECIYVEEQKDSCYAKIDEKKCVNCKKCQSVCPLNEVSYNSNIKTYAAYSKENETRKRSASGGIGFEIAKMIIEENGLVCGAAWSKEKNYVEHILVDNINNLYKLQGSKYVHSVISRELVQEINNVKESRKVCFFGTPCQVMGMKNIFGESVIYVDLICHGITDYAVWTKYLDYEKKRCKLSKAVQIVSFRQGSRFDISFYQEDGSCKTIPFNQSLYMNHYLEGTIYRNNCYECIFAKRERVGDITLGDFWGLKSDSSIHNFDMTLGDSVVLVNTERAIELLKSIENRIVIEERAFDEACNGNGQLNAPCTRSKYAERFSFLRKHFSTTFALIMCKPKKFVVTELRFFLGKIRSVSLNSERRL